ncbi:16S rRNA (uracil(1498)-N(3))-methyltransferase [Legionella spiritensis]|uniref:Ribosomal RNA small subunit methyltransferase E n=1 Tax=Legionella spiritensis TaxID=452 RepID=A0A0W0ZB17_LEGSP|nr:16S rRNA (uracil(1498)-N(3))-methyltransferase [Legionella spiritensis]KTD66337.1 16S rRNA methyltransferase [Legionella spiritensis]SNV48696.1 16S rRNA methyltransferase [Legionella spiritensis]
MRDVRIYQPGDFQVGESVALSEEAGRHVGVVLRMQPGEKLILFPGDNREFVAEIVAVHKKKVSVLLQGEQTVNREPPIAVHLAQAISKGDRMEWVVQKAVELGVAQITPVITERCMVKPDAARLAKKRLQWQAIAVSACEQCGRNRIPTVHDPVAFSDFLHQPHAGTRFVLHPETGKNWRDYSQGFEEAVLFIGPEGGLTAQELEQSAAAGFAPLTLGARVLRTETAAVVGLSVLQAVWGDL